MAFFAQENKEGLHDALIKFYELEAYNVGIDKKFLKDQAVVLHTNKEVIHVYF